MLFVCVELSVSTVPRPSTPSWGMCTGSGRAESRASVQGVRSLVWRPQGAGSTSPNRSPKGARGPKPKSRGSPLHSGVKHLRFPGLTVATPLLATDSLPGVTDR